MKIVIDPIESSQVIKLLQEHLDDMHATSPPESVHALDLSGLQHKDVTFWTLWEDEQVLGCAALKSLDDEHGEIKSMRTHALARRKGVGERLLKHVINEAKQRGYKQLSLETGSMAFFAPAHALYSKFGFGNCGPFADYQEDPNSRFMTLFL